MVKNLSLECAFPFGVHSKTAVTCGVDIDLETQYNKLWLKVTVIRCGFFFIENRGSGQLQGLDQSRAAQVEGWF